MANDAQQHNPGYSYSFSTDKYSRIIVFSLNNADEFAAILEENQHLVPIQWHDDRAPVAAPSVFIAAFPASQ